MDEHASETNADSREPLSFEQIVSWERPSDPRISPDGQNIAFCVRPVSNDEEHPKGSIWLVPFEGGEPRRLTSSAGLDQSPRWSPDGSRIAFLSDRAERGKTSVYVMRVDGGEAERCFDQQGDVGGLAWSLDGRFLSVLFTEPETEEEKKRKEERDDVRVWDTDYKYRRLWIIDVQSGDTRVVSPENRHVREYCWSADSAQVARQHVCHAASRRIALPVRSGDRRPSERHGLSHVHVARERVRSDLVARRHPLRLSRRRRPCDAS